MGLHIKETRALLKQFQNNQARFANDAMAIATSSSKKECFSTFLSIRQNFVDEICQEALQILHKEPLESVVANDGFCLDAVNVAAPRAEEELVVQSLEQDVVANTAVAEVAAAPLAEETIVYRSFEEEFRAIVESEIAADPRAEVRLKAFAQFITSGVVEKAELAQKYVEFVRLSEFPNLISSEAAHRRYIIERRKIGSGGYGMCHRGLCLRTGQFVCVKRLKRTTGICRKTCK